MNIHATAIVHPTAELGTAVSIGPYAVIGEHVSLGDGTRVGPHVVIDGWTAVGKTGGRRIGVRIERGVIDRATARPEPAAAHFV